ncbi:ribonuclease III [Podospora aff. communis PSN243]|uniref:Ribonuclease III n=1 Tax=Podospora aff. communis PSN243 TaxID=3040156 RepID=A0AAV9H582_9PEZI|nr:ribonuclease III [Podospora aff. communis PSN243]
MGKRTHQDSPEGASASSKRIKSDGKESSTSDESALALILESSDELIDCLRCLKEGSQRGGQSASAKENLSLLSRKLLPSFQKLGQSAQIPTPTRLETEPSMQVPHPGFVTKWSSADISTTKPPLPAILDPEIENAALTHRGRNESSVNYERLEWLGDAYLEVIATALIHQTFPRHQAGRVAQLRELLVRNLTLSTFTTAYGLDHRAKLPEEFNAGGRFNGTTASAKMRTKALGDLFEAYVGAVILSDPKDGVQRAADWLKVLWAPTIEKHIQEEGKQAPVPADQVNPKSKLEALVGAKGIKIEYQDRPSQKKDRDSNLPLFVVACVFHGYGETKELGYGTALGKKEAGQKAAQQALLNKKALQPYIKKKEEFLAARKAQAALAAENGEESVAGSAA